jgi:hypothetical protein
LLCAVKHKLGAVYVAINTCIPKTAALNETSNIELFHSFRFSDHFGCVSRNSFSPKTAALSAISYDSERTGSWSGLVVGALHHTDHPFRT